jgi:hypothetical protein
MTTAIEPIRRNKSLIVVAISLLAVSASVINGAFLQTLEDERIKNRIATIISQTVGQEAEVKGVKVWTRMPPKREAVTEIKSFGDKAVPPLIEYLRDKDPRIRNQAMEFLGLLKTTKAIEPLKKVALTDASPTSRQIALRWLSILPWDSVSSIMQQAIKDPDVSVRNEARSLIKTHKK